MGHIQTAMRPVQLQPGARARCRAGSWLRGGVSWCSASPAHRSASRRPLAGAVDVYNAWFDGVGPYSNVATQGTRDPAGDSRCVLAHSADRLASAPIPPAPLPPPPTLAATNSPDKDVVTYWKYVHRRRCAKSVLLPSPPCSHRGQPIRRPVHFSRYVRLQQNGSGVVGIDSFAALGTTTYYTDITQLITSWDVFLNMG